MFVRVLFASLICSFSLNTLAESRLFLVGGSWKTCGSFSTKACKSKSAWQGAVKTENIYGVSAAKIAKIKNLDKWTKEDQRLKGALLNVLQNFQRIHKDATFGRGAFRDQLKNISIGVGGKSTDGKKLLGGLPDHLYYPIYDILEAPNLGKNGEFIKEQASISNTKYDSSRAIYTAFMASVKKVTPEGQKPMVLISTASGYDVFGATDYYLNIFEQLGADARWLPVEATLGKLADADQVGSAELCKKRHAEREDYVGVYGREQVYPYLADYQTAFCENPQNLVELAKQANGIFFNGGDQSLTWQAFVKPDNSDRPWLAALRQSFDAGKLVISGTSAGTAVQSGKAGSQNAGMITGGTSDGAIISGAENKMPWIERADPENNIRPVTFHGFGGLKFFPYGVLDTHFSERGRQLRLAKLVLESDATFGFGVDETTALATTPIDDNNADFEVIGQNGVYIVEQTATSTSQKDRIQFISHYLVNGQKFQLRGGKLVFSDNEFDSFTAENEQVKSGDDLTQDVFYRDLVEKQIKRNAAMALAAFSNNQRTFTVAIQLNEKSGVSKTRSMDKLHGYTNALVSVLLQ